MGMGGPIIGGPYKFYRLAPYTSDYSFHSTIEINRIYVPRSKHGIWMYMAYGHPLILQILTMGVPNNGLMTHPFDMKTTYVSAMAHNQIS